MLVTIDFETYHDAEYSLTKLSTSEYVRDPRFEPISCSIKKDDNTPFCYFGKEAIAAAFAKLDWSQVEALAHHAQFDGLILSHHFGHKPRLPLPFTGCGECELPRLLFLVPEHQPRRGLRRLEHLLAGAVLFDEHAHAPRSVRVGDLQFQRRRRTDHLRSRFEPHLRASR